MISISGPSLQEVDRSSNLYRKLADLHLRLAEKDSTIWGARAQKEASIRLNWIDAPASSMQLIPDLQRLKERFSGLNNLILCGMGGSSLAPEVFAKSFAKQLFIVDSTDPNYIAHTDGFDLAKTLVVISSKSGTTIELIALRNYFIDRFLKAGLKPKDHMVVVTDPQSVLDIDARKNGFTVITADPHIGGRFSALSAFGLVPAFLMGIDVAEVLTTAQSAKKSFIENPSMVLDTTYIISEVAGQYLSFSDGESNLPGLSDWIEQLIAESTGKEQKGRLPISTPLGANSPDALKVSFGEDADLIVQGHIGEQFIFWEWVTALVAAVLEVDAFNQPNVTEAKEATNDLLRQWGGKAPTLTPDADEEEIEIYGHGVTVTSALKNLIMNTDIEGYIAIMAYLDRQDDAKIMELQEILADKSGRPVSFGWGPRFLHSTGQFHKGGQQNGSFLQITGNSNAIIAIPEMEFDFKTLITAQAVGDGIALSERRFPILRLNLINRAVGIEQLLSAARAI